MLVNNFDIVQRNYDYGRFYDVTTEDKKQYSLVSVTTLKKKFSDMSVLFSWQDRVGEEEAQRISQNSANRGNKVHKWMEDYFKYGVMPHPEKSEAYDCFTRLCQVFPLIQPVAIEHKTYWVNEYGQGFAGTLDLLSNTDLSRLRTRNNELLGEGFTLTVNDLKTWNKAKYPSGQTREGKKYYTLIEYGLQIAAYCAALNQRTNKELGINKGLVFGVTKNCRSPFIYYFNPDAIFFYWTKWKEMLNCYYNNEHFSWFDMEQEADNNGYLGERVDIVQG